VLNAHTVVAENRKEGLHFLEAHQSELILLDDAFQHRKVSCDVNLILSDFNKPYFKDYLMPMGRLRESSAALKRADALIFTKCPIDLNSNQKNELKSKVKWVKNVFFSAIEYSEPTVLKGTMSFNQMQFNRIVAVSAIANSKPFVQHCQSICDRVLVMDFKDHHDYQFADVQRMIAQLDENTLVLCTEKDAVKLRSEKFDSILPINRFFYVPITTTILFDEAEQLKSVLDVKLAVN
jgi:tetraacyldisaccharide 4'-kinase